MTTAWFHATYGKVAAGLYASGVILHLLHLASPDGGVEAFPFWFDAVAVVAGAYALVGFLQFTTTPGSAGWLGLVHWAIVGHLLLTLVIHTASLIRGDHVFLAPFDTVWFSLLAVPTYAGFAVYGWSLGP